MADSQHRDRFAVFDFEQSDIAAAPERNDQFLEEGRVGSRFATRKRRTPRRREAILSLNGRLGECEIGGVAFEDEAVQ